MIGPWNNAGCTSFLAPGAWPPPGNVIADKYTGNHPMYPLALLAMSFNFFTSAFGYKTATGSILTDGIDDYGEISSAQQLWANGTPFSHELIIKPQITPAGIEVISIFSDFGGAAPFRLMFIDIATYLGLSITCGNNLAKFGYGNRATFHNLKKHIGISYNGGGVNIIGNWALYLDGSPVALSTYSGVSAVGDNKNYYFTNNAPGFHGQCELWAAVTYNRVLSAAEFAVNAGLGDNYGLKGINVGDLMGLTPAAAVARGVPAGIFEGSH